jgi:hypothetical protein
VNTGIITSYEGTGVYLGAGGGVTNARTIYGLNAAVSLALGGQVTNEACGRLSASLLGIAASGTPATVSNAGLIEATFIPAGVFVDTPIPVADGISLAAGGIITILTGGIITGTTDGVYGGAALTVVNAGTIAVSSHPTPATASSCNKAERSRTRPAVQSSGRRAACWPIPASPL